MIVPNEKSRLIVEIATICKLKKQSRLAWKIAPIEKITTNLENRDWFRKLQRKKVLTQIERGNEQTSSHLDKNY